MAGEASWYFEDFKPGQSFLSQGRTVLEADIAGFGAWSWDTNPVHTDAELMASSRFGQRIAHGMLGISIAMGLASRLGVFETCSIALLGIEDWKFRAPVFVGDTVRCRVEILSTRLTSTREFGVLDRRFTLLNQRDEIVQVGRIGLLVSTTPRSSS
jgi:acyl dehydratase